MCVKYKSPLHSLRRQRLSQLQCVLGHQTGKVLRLALPPQQCSKASLIQIGYIVHTVRFSNVCSPHKTGVGKLQPLANQRARGPENNQYATRYSKAQNQSPSQNGTSGEIPKSPQTIYKRSTRSLLREPSYPAPHTLLTGVDV